jgi:hypothetical protein
VLFKSHYYPQRGRQATLADPDGAVFAVLAAEGGDAPDYLAKPVEPMPDSRQSTQSENLWDE